MIDSLRAFEYEGVPDEIAVSIVQFLRDWQGDQSLLVNPNDDVYQKYGIVDEDLDDFVIFVAERSNRKLPDDSNYWSRPIRTLQDLADFVSTFPIR